MNYFIAHYCAINYFIIVQPSYFETVRDVMSKKCWNMCMIEYLTSTKCSNTDVEMLTKSLKLR